MTPHTAEWAGHSVEAGRPGSAVERQPGPAAIEGRLQNAGLHAVAAGEDVHGEQRARKRPLSATM